MQNKTKNIKEKVNNESGLVIVEAAIVFPVMFFVLLFIIFIGNMYYEQARIDAIVLSYATKGAQYVTTPTTYGDKIPTNVKSVDVEPYRYVLGTAFGGSIKDIENDLDIKIREEINNNGLAFFKGGGTKIVSDGKLAKYHSYLIYSVFIVEVDYEIKFPIRFLGADSPTIIKLSSRSEVSVNDTSEFVRNIDMIVDLTEEMKVADNIKSIFSKINDFISKFGK